MVSTFFRMLCFISLFYSFGLAAEPYPGQKKAVKVDEPVTEARPARTGSAPIIQKNTTSSGGSGDGSRYFGIEIGRSTPDESDFETANSLRLTIGGRSNKNFAIEGSFVSLGKFESSDELNEAIAFELGASDVSASVKITGIELAVRGEAPLNDKFSLYGKAGLFIWNADFDVKVDGLSGSDSDSGSDLMLGVGALINLNKKVSLRAGYNLTQASEEDVSNISAGLNINF